MDRIMGGLVQIMILPIAVEAAAPAHFQAAALPRPSHLANCRIGRGRQLIESGEELRRLSLEESVSDEAVRCRHRAGELVTAGTITAQRGRFASMNSVGTGKIRLG